MHGCRVKLKIGSAEQFQADRLNFSPSASSNNAHLSSSLLCSSLFTFSMGFRLLNQKVARSGEQDLPTATIHEIPAPTDLNGVSFKTRCPACQGVRQENT